MSGLCLKIFLFVLNAKFVASVVIGVNDEVLKEGEVGSPGVKFGITQKFSLYANEVFMDILGKVATRLVISDVTFKTRENLLKFSNLKVTNFKSPNVSTTDFEEPNMLKFNLHNITAEVSGKFETKYNGLTATGLFDGKAVDLDVTATMEVSQGSYGRLHLSSSECVSKIAKFDLHVYEAGIFEQLFKALKFFLVGYVKANVEEKICNEFKNLVNNYLDRKLEDFPTKVFLSSFFPTKNVSGNNILKKLQDILDRLVLDYSLVGHPLVTNDSLNLHSRSEVSLEGRGDTPFFPVPMSDHCEISMICLSVSDYVMNSFLWHAYKQGSLNFVIDNLKVQKFGHLFETPSCDEHQEICINRVVTEAERIFPDREFKLTVHPVEAPAIIIADDKAFITTKNYVNLIAYDETSSTSIVETEFEAEARFTPYLQNDSLIYANFSVEKFALKLIHSSELISLNETILDTFGRYIKRLVEDNLNKFLRNGIRLPQLKEVLFVDTNFKLMNRHLKIQTNVEVMKNDLHQLISDAFKK